MKLLAFMGGGDQTDPITSAKRRRRIFLVPWPEWNQGCQYRLRGYAFAAGGGKSGKKNSKTQQEL